MSRLTKYFADRDEYGYNLCHGGCESCNGVLCGNALEMVKKLAYYEDLEEQGRLIEQKHGRWIHKDNFIGKYLMCSECSHVTGMKSNYCPNCGAKMDEVE